MKEENKYEENETQGGRDGEEKGAVTCSSAALTITTRIAVLVSSTAICPTAVGIYVCVCVRVCVCVCVCM
jgi:hypothetical protein